MAEPTLQQVYGPNATQDANFVHISKTDLAVYGLVPAAVNTAESIKVALDLMNKSFFTAANQTTNPDQQIVMDDGFNSFVTRNSQTYIQRQVTTSYQEPYTAAVLNPMKY